MARRKKLNSRIESPMGRRRQKKKKKKKKKQVRQFECKQRHWIKYSKQKDKSEQREREMESITDRKKENNRLFEKQSM